MSQYQKIFTGSSIHVLALRDALESEGITAVVKDDSESARLAGFGSPALQIQEVFVHEDEHEKALKVLDQLSD